MRGGAFPAPVKHVRVGGGAHQDEDCFHPRGVSGEAGVSRFAQVRQGEIEHKRKPCRRLVPHAAKKLKHDELLVLSLGATILRKHLDDVPLWRGHHVEVRTLADDFARYLYLPRVAGPETIFQAIRDGVSSLTWPTDTFAYAESHDEAANRYRGLRAGQNAPMIGDGGGLVVKPDLARQQLEAEVAAPTGGGGQATTATTIAGQTTSSTTATEGGGSKPQPVVLRRYHATVRLDSTRVGRDASRIAEEVIAHLAGQTGADVQVTLEIEARLPAGASDQIVRIVTENSRTLKFDNHGFERE